MKLPELPEPVRYQFRFKGNDSDLWLTDELGDLSRRSLMRESSVFELRALYTADQLRERDRQIVQLCAAVCIEQGRKAATLDGQSFYIGTGQCAAAIRALLEKP